MHLGGVHVLDSQKKNFWKSGYTVAISIGRWKERYVGVSPGLRFDHR
jgi:hypothetical protein